MNRGRLSFRFNLGMLPASFLLPLRLGLCCLRRLGLCFLRRLGLCCLRRLGLYCLRRLVTMVCVIHTRVAFVAWFVLPSQARPFMSSSNGRQPCRFGRKCKNSYCGRWHGPTQRNDQDSNLTWDGQPASHGQPVQGYPYFNPFNFGFSSLGQTVQGYPYGPHATFGQPTSSGQPTPSQHAGLGQQFSNPMDPYSSFGRQSPGQPATHGQEHDFMLTECPTYSARVAFVTHLDGNNARCMWETGGSFKTVLPDNHGLRTGYRIIITYDTEKVRDIRRCATHIYAVVLMKPECSRQGLDLFC